MWRGRLLNTPSTGEAKDAKEDLSGARHYYQESSEAGAFAGGKDSKDWHFPPTVDYVCFNDDPQSDSFFTFVARVTTKPRHRPLINMWNSYAPVLHALAALGRGKPADSVERLQIALPYELAVNGLNFGHGYLGGLHSAYVRGEAFLALHRYAEAAAEFQKIRSSRYRGRGSHWRAGALAARESVLFIRRQG